MDVRIPHIIAFGAPAAAAMFPVFLVQFYLLNFSTDVLLLAPATAGALMMMARIWDAVTDPLVGSLSDRTRSGMGRRRPWLFVGAPIVALAFLAVWNPPQGLTPTVLTLWIGVMLLLSATADTLWSLPHRTLGTELSTSPITRSRLFGTRQFFVLATAASAFGVVQLIGTADNPRETAATFAMIVAPIIFLILLIPPSVLRESATRSQAAFRNPIQVYRLVLRQPNAQRLVAVRFLEDIGNGTQAAIAPFVAIYVVERTDLIGVIPASFIGPLICSIPLWIWSANRFGLVRTWQVALTGAGLAFGSLMVIPTDNISIMFVTLGIAGFFSGASGPILPTILGNLIDRDEQQLGERPGGAYFAVMELVQKVSQALVVLAVGLMLQAVGFIANQPQTEFVQTAILASLALVPATSSLLAAFLLRRLEVHSQPLEHAR